MMVSVGRAGYLGRLEGAGRGGREEPVGFWGEGRRGHRIHRWMSQEMGRRGGRSDGYSGIWHPGDYSLAFWRWLG